MPFGHNHMALADQRVKRTGPSRLANRGFRFCEQIINRVVYLRRDHTKEAAFRRAFPNMCGAHDVSSFRLSWAPSDIDSADAQSLVSDGR